MKFRLILPLLLLFPVAAKAAPEEPKIVARDPQAMALFEQSLAAYRKLDGLRLTMRLEMVNDKGQPATQNEIFEWKRPYFSRWQITDDRSFVSVSNGVEKYQKLGSDEATRTKIISIANRGLPFAEPFLRWLLIGQNPLFHFDVVSSQARLRCLPRAVQAGALCDGVEMAVRFQFGKREQTETKTVWFDAKTHLVRATQRHIEAKKGDEKFSLSHDYFFDRVEVNPRFAPNTFNWPAALLQTQAVEEAQTSWDKTLREGQVAPRVEGTDLRGAKISLSALKGQVVIVDFWATWCSPCAQQMVDIGKLQKQINSPDLRVIGVSFDLDKAALMQFVRVGKVAAPQIFDGLATEGANAKRFGLTAIPFVIVVGKDGKIAALNPHGATLERAVRAALNK